MKIAVPYENGMIYQHFGHTKTFRIYQAEEGQVIGKEFLSASGSGHNAMASLLQNNDVDILVCGGIGDGARKALDAAKIRIYGGVFDVADLAVDALLKGTLEYNPDALCDRHNHKGDHNTANDSCTE